MALRGEDEIMPGEISAQYFRRACAPCHACHLPPPHLLRTWTAEGGPLDETVVDSRCESAIEGNIHETLMIEILET